MKFKPSVEEDLLWKMFIYLKDFKNRMVSTGTERDSIEGYQSRMLS
jgi:hypothetical protein